MSGSVERDPVVVKARRRLGARLHDLRDGAGLTQAQLAARVGFHRTTVVYAERGTRHTWRELWERADEVLNAGGELTHCYDEYKAITAACRRSASDSAREHAVLSSQMQAQHSTLVASRFGANALPVTAPGFAQQMVSARKLGQHADGDAPGQLLQALVGQIETHDIDVRGDQPQQTSGSRATPPAVVDLLWQIDGVAQASGLFRVEQADGVWRIGDADIGRLVAVTDLYRSVDREWGGGLLQARLARLAECATLWLDPSRVQVEDRLRGALTAAVADVRVQAGWTAFDAGSYGDSQRHFLLAERAAVLGGRNLLAAKIRYCQARQFQHQQHNADALQTVQFAQQELGAAGTPAVTAMLHGAEAASQAALGNGQAALRCLQQATEAFAAIDPAREPSWMSFYDRGELEAQYGRVYRDLARHHRRAHRIGVARTHPDYGADAVAWVDRALTHFDPGNARSVMLNRVSLCSALFLADQPDRAVDVGAQLLPATTNLSSRRVLERVANIQRDIPDDCRHSGVQDFRRLLSALEAAP